MDRDVYNGMVNDLHMQRTNLSAGKSRDYATDDVLSNFKRMNTMCKLLDIDVRRSPGDCARFLLMLKMDRWCNLARLNTNSVNEFVKDTVMDAHNYIDLAHACEVDRSTKSTVPQDMKQCD